MSSSRNIRLLLTYDGTKFNGWQIQASGRTVQGVVEDCLKRLHKHPTRIIGAGRTDSGVHARGQVANFISEVPSIPAKKYCDALNSILPKDVRVLGSAEVPKEFHSRYDAKRRTYRYYILAMGDAYPWEYQYCLQLRRTVDIQKLIAMAECFTGTHDFTAFSAADKEQQSTKRCIEFSGFYIERGFLVYQISGNAFLWKMVRSIVGTLLDFEESGKGPEETAAVLASKDRSLAGTTAPPQGLFLHHIDYGEEYGSE